MIPIPVNSDDLKKKAVAYVKDNANKIIEKFANDDICPPEEKPYSFFMAGSPGAGKTEFSQQFIRATEMMAVRIDADEIKNEIPFYTGKNVDEIQGASALGLQKIFDYCIKKSKTVVVDGTFASYGHSFENVSRSLRKGRPTEIFYIYQDPIRSWHFSKVRELKEGRPVSKEFFISSLFQSIENVNKVKAHFGDRIQLHLIKKDYNNSLEKFEINIPNLDSFIKIPYNDKTLYEQLLD